MDTLETVNFCRYHYDPLDRLVNILPATQDATARFYNRSRLATEIQGQTQRSVFQHGDLLLAQRQQQGQSTDTALLLTDHQRSVLRAADGQCSSMAYSPYGHRPAENGPLSLLGFNGEQPDPLTGHYLLGNGYRAYNPVLMRFNSSDSFSPFGDGGLNAYAYVLGDPVNRVDPTGRFGVISSMLGSISSAVWAAFSKSKPIGRASNLTYGQISAQAEEMVVINKVRALHYDNASVVIGERNSKKGLPRLVIWAHGSGKMLGRREHAYYPDHVARAIKAQYPKFSEEFSSVQLLSCRGADGGPFSVGQRLADVLDKRVKAYQGVISSHNPSFLDRGPIEAARKPVVFLAARSSLPYRTPRKPFRNVYMPEVFHPRGIRRQ